jgi:CHAD domain-containing protein
VSTEQAVEEYARRQLEKLGKSVKQLRQGDPMAIHDARVASRRLEAALDVMRQRMTQQPRGPEGRRLQRLRRRLSPLREREGMAESLRKLLEPAPPATREAGQRLLDRWADRITRGRRRAVRRIERRYRQLLLLRADAELRRVPAEADALRGTSERWAEVRRRDAESALALALRTQQVDDLHEARLAVKKWRYATEVRAAATGETQEQENARLIELQRCLGSIHEADVLLEILRRRSRRWRRQNLAARAAALTPLLRRLGGARRRDLRQLEKAGGTVPSLEPSTPPPSGF